MPTKKKQEKKQPARQGAKEMLAGYEELLSDLKARIHSAQIKAATSVNRELIELYWEIGKGIVERQEKASWGEAALDRLSRDLMRDFPEMQGFSRRNLYRMRAVYLAYRDASEFVPQVVAQIPWGHNIMVLEKLKDPDERLWYIQQTIQYGWSRNVLRHHIETRLYQRQAKAEKSTNFAATLPPPHSDLVEQTIKDEYIFDFLTLREGAHERELERALVERIRDFLLELGSGFAFLGSQYHLEVGGQDFYIDLLFYQFGKEDLAVEGEDEFAAADRRLHCITTKHRIECRQYDWASAWKLKSLRARPTMRLFETLARAFGKGVLPVKVRTLNERINIEFVVR